MKCSKCHNEITEGQEVCLKCGHILRYESEHSTKKCIHCYRKIPYSYKKCPYCKKKQYKSRNKLLMILFIILTIYINYVCISRLEVIHGLSFSVVNKQNYDEIKYEDLVRKNVYYDESFVKITGTIKEVDSSISLLKVIKIQIIVDSNKEENVIVYYRNKNSVGFLNGDEITIYGKYKKLSGNTPVINAQLIEIDSN